MYLVDMNCEERFTVFLMKVMYIEESADLTLGERGQQQMLYVILDFTQTKPSCIAMILVLASCCWLNVKVRREWCKCSDCIKGFVFLLQVAKAELTVYDRGQLLIRSDTHRGFNHFGIGRVVMVGSVSESIITPLGSTHFLIFLQLLLPS